MSQTFVLPPITIRASPGSWSGNPIRLPPITVYGSLPKPSRPPSYNRPVIPIVPNKPITPPISFRPPSGSPLRPLPPVYHAPVIPVYKPPVIPPFKPPVVPVFKPIKIPIFKPPPIPVFKPPTFPNMPKSPSLGPRYSMPKGRDEWTDEKVKIAKEKMKERMKQDAKKKQDEFFMKVAEEVKKMGPAKDRFDNEHSISRAASYKRLQKASWLHDEGILNAAARQEVSLAPASEGRPPIREDEYTITMDRMPAGLSPEQFLVEFANNPNKTASDIEFVLLSYFMRRSTDRAEVGDVYDIMIPGDPGSVMLVDKKSNYFIFQTVTTESNNIKISPENTGSHPVRGAREFGFDKHSDGSVTFYTRGYDRAEWVGSSIVGTPLQKLTWTAAFNAIGDRLASRGGTVRAYSFTDN